MVAEGRCAEWLSRLVRVPSVTPLQAGPRAGTPGETELARQVADWFRAFGGEVIVDEFLPDRPNVFGLWRTSCSSTWAGVDAHLDTVGVEAMTGDPFSGDIRDGRVWGRGSTDTKATLAVTLALLEGLHRRGAKPTRNLLVAATSDEEGTALGAPAMANWLRERKLVLDELVVAEPTHCGPIHGHKGVLRMRFDIEGLAVHSCNPGLGRNAVSAGARLVAAMEEEHARLGASGSDNGLGPGTLTVTIFRGGEGVNIVPPNCEIWIDRRITAGESAAAQRERLSQIARSASPLSVKVSTIHEIDAFFQPPEAPLVRDFARWSGRDPSIVAFCTNAWAYKPDVARQCVVIGPGSIDQAHTADEWVSVAELGKLAGVFGKWWGGA
jgi:acetylornithine deacetylase/succinyl-diaminopimelate desuccinylase-like protein